MKNNLLMEKPITITLTVVVSIVGVLCFTKGFQAGLIASWVAWLFLVQSLSCSTPARTTEGTMMFKDVALGAKFKYPEADKVWIKLSHYDRGLIAEYNEELIRTPHWVGQQICSAHEGEDVKVEVIG